MPILRFSQSLSLLIHVVVTSCVDSFSLRSHVHSISTALAAEAGERQRVVVVGGGVGGLAVASRIASNSKEAEVVVLEKNSFLGGRCGSFEVQTEKGRFRHERGPSLLLLKDVYEDLFRDTTGGSRAAFGLDIVQCVPAYQVVFDDGDRIELGYPTGDSPAAEMALSTQKMNRYEVDGAAKWDEYMRACAAFLDCGLPNFIEERLEITSFPAFLWEALRESGKAWPLKPHSDVLDAIFVSNKMRALASFQNLYVGLQPYRSDKEIAGGVLRKTAPAVFGLLAAIELHPSNKYAGVFAPIGGFEAVANAFVRLAESLGVTMRCDSTVLQVNDDGVVVKDSSGTQQFLEADLVVVNADFPYATKTILSNDSNETYDWDAKYDFSSGVIAFHWSVDMELSDLNTHNVFLVSESRAKAQDSWRCLANPPNGDGIDNEEFEPFNFYVHRAGKTDPSAAPKGCDAILVLVPCATLQRDENLSKLPRDEAIRAYRDQFGESVVDAARKAVLARLSAIESLANLGNHIINEVVDTPGSYADLYNAAAGTPFALSHGFGQLSLTRPGAESSRHSNVLHVGASNRPGNGVPLVLIGAKQVAAKAIERLKQARSS